MIRATPKSLNGRKEESLLALENPESNQRSCRKHLFFFFSWPWHIDTGYLIAKFFTCFKAYFSGSFSTPFLVLSPSSLMLMNTDTELSLHKRQPTPPALHHSRLYEDSSWSSQSTEKISIFRRNLIWVKYCWLSTWTYQIDNFSAILSLLNLCLLHTFTHCSQSRENKSSTVHNP